MSAYPIPVEPASGCSEPGGATATVTLGPDGPDPLCVVLSVDQQLLVRNGTGEELGFVLDALQETVRAGEVMSLGVPGSELGPGRYYFWSPAHTELSGILKIQ